MTAILKFLLIMSTTPWSRDWILEKNIFASIVAASNLK
jgi:hypothetical protein